MVRTRWNSPLAAGIAINVAHFAPPPDCPKIVTFPGSPPNSANWASILISFDYIKRGHIFLRLPLPESLLIVCRVIVGRVVRLALLS